tara:strand:+ start:546 stop:1181 length:636 start_codon:yes stop_codon:yes gene_type:complete
MSIKLNAQSGGSVALNAPTQTTSSADVTFKLPVADGTAGQVLKTDGSGNLSWGNDSGVILQVKQTVKTDQFTSTAYAYTDITGLSVDITPSSASNKILVSFELQVGGSANNYASFRLLRDSTHIGASTVTDTDWRVGTLGSLSHENSYQLENTGTSFLDSPNTTSAITYKLQVSSYSNRTVSINYPTSTGNSSGSYTATGISTITVMEVAA